MSAAALKIPTNLPSLHESPFEGTRQCLAPSMYWASLSVNEDAWRETIDNGIVYWSYVVSYAGAEKGDEGMALKIW